MTSVPYPYGIGPKEATGYRFCVSLAWWQVAYDGGEAGPANGQHSLDIDDCSIHHVRGVLDLRDASPPEVAGSKYRI